VLTPRKRGPKTEGRKIDERKTRLWCYFETGLYKLCSTTLFETVDVYLNQNVTARRYRVILLELHFNPPVFAEQCKWHWSTGA